MISRCAVLLALVAGLAFAAETPISTPPVGPTSAGVSYQGVAAAALGEGFVGFWMEGSECTSLELHGMRFDRQMRTLDERSFFIAQGRGRSRVIGAASDGERAYVAWLVPKFNQFDITVHVARIDAGGGVTILSDDVPILGTPVAVSVSRDYIVFLASNNAQQGALTVTLLDRGGRVVRGAVPVVDPSVKVASADAVVAGNNVIVGWIDGDKNVHAAAISLDDIAANRVVPAPSPAQPAGTATSLRLATDGTHVMAFWTDFFPGTLRVRAMNGAANPIGAGPVTLGAFRPAQIVPLATSDGYRLFFTQSDGGPDYLVALRVGFDGTLQSVAQHSPSPALSFNFAIAQSGGTTVVVRTEHRSAPINYDAGTEAVASAVAADGSFGPATLLSLGPPAQRVRKLLPFDAGAAALWIDSAPNDRLVAGRLSASGKPLDGAGVRLRDSERDQTGSAMATDGERLAVVWTEGPPDLYTRQPVYLAIVSFGGSPAVSVRQLDDNAAPGSDFGITWNGTAYVVSWRRWLPGGAYDLAALRVDRDGNPIDPAPVSLAPATWYDVRPRLAWNGRDYLLLWERWYDPFTYVEPVTCIPQRPLPNELFAQRFSAALTALGAPIPLATTTNYNDYLLDVQGDDALFGNGVWMIAWADRWSQAVVATRVDADGRRLDPLNGRPLFYSCGVPFPAPAAGGWTIASQDECIGGKLRFVQVGADGASSAPSASAILPYTVIDSVAFAPTPIFAYRRSGSIAAYVDVIPQRPRTVRR